MYVSLSLTPSCSPVLQSLQPAGIPRKGAMRLYIENWYVPGQPEPDACCLCCMTGASELPWQACMRIRKVVWQQ